MTALDRLIVQLAAVVLLVLGAWFWHAHAVSAARQAGWDAAVLAGEKQRSADAAKALQTERNLRNRLSEQDEAARAEREQHAQNLADAQRRMRAGTDRLRCPAAAVQPTAAPANGSAAAGSAPDGPGADVVPEVAADILGLAADSDAIVSKFDRLVERFEACRALNNGTQPAD